MKNKARLSNKVYRKIHWLLYSKLKLGKKLNGFYLAYRHRNKKPVSNDLSSIYITHVPNEGAGIGHQISNFNNGVFCAKLLGVKFAYPGFVDKKWDEFLGFGQGEKSLAQLKKEGYKFRTLPYFNESEASLDVIRKIISSYGGQKVVFKINLDQFYQRQYDVIPFIKGKFESAKARENDSLIYNPEHINIAVHIRRGDIVVGQTNKDASLTKRWLTMEYYEDIIKDIYSALNGDVNSRFANIPLLIDNKKKGAPIDIYLFSQGNEEDYRTFEKYGNVHYCLDMSPMDSFLHMVRSDILVISKSSFSYKPALLADGIRICPEHFWHGYPKDEKWIKVCE